MVLGPSEPYPIGISIIKTKAYGVFNKLKEIFLDLDYQSLSFIESDREEIPPSNSWDCMSMSMSMTIASVAFYLLFIYI